MVLHPEEIAEQALDKIISIGNNSHPVIQAQAEAFRKEIKGSLGELSTPSGGFT